MNYDMYKYANNYICFYAKLFTSVLVVNLLV